MSDPRQLDNLFLPSSVAVYGASTRDPSKLGNSLLRNAKAGALDEIVAVSPSAGEAEGLTTVPSLDHPVDLALISVPDRAVEAAIDDAASAGARCAVILTSGFGETGEAGKAVERRIVERAATAGMRVQGPNCMGVVSHLGGDRWLNGSYFWRITLRPGPISLLSQSGAFGGMFLSQVDNRGLGFRRFASLGNAADLDETAMLEWLADDEHTGVIALFAEAISGGRRFVEVVRSITAERPVVVLKSGRSEAGTRAAASHTGSIAGGHGAVSAALRRAGAIETHTSDEFFDVLAAVSSPQPRPSGSRVAVVTISGGPSVLAADAATAAGLDVRALGPETVARLRAVVPDFAATGNPVDLTPQCALDAYEPAVDAVFDDPEIDGVIAINCGLDLEPFGRAVAAAARRTGKPSVGFVSDAPTVASLLTDGGIPLFPSPERAANGLAALGLRPQSNHLLTAGGRA